MIIAHFATKALATAARVALWRGSTDTMRPSALSLLINDKDLAVAVVALRAQPMFRIEKKRDF